MSAGVLPLTSHAFSLPLYWERGDHLLDLRGFGFEGCTLPACSQIRPGCEDHLTPLEWARNIRPRIHFLVRYPAASKRAWMCSQSLDSIKVAPSIAESDLIARADPKAHAEV